MTSTVEGMPAVLYTKLMGLVEDKNISGYNARLIDVWQSTGPRGYWRAKVSINGVVVRYYYTPTLERWKRS